jgi:hypothetical protein
MRTRRKSSPSCIASRRFKLARSGSKYDSLSMQDCEVEGYEATPATRGHLGRPAKSNKKAKVANKAMSATAVTPVSSVAVDEELHKMMLETSNNNKERRARDEVRWALMFDNTEKKIELKRAKAEAAKIEANATMIKALNEASQLAVTKMVEEAKILTTDTSTMGPEEQA